MVVVSRTGRVTCIVVINSKENIRLRVNTCQLYLGGLRPVKNRPTAAERYKKLVSTIAVMC